MDVIVSLCYLAINMAFIVEPLLSFHNVGFMNIFIVRELAQEV